MLAKGHMSEKVFGQIPSHPFSKVASLSQLGGNASHQGPINGQSDWHKYPIINCLRDLVRKRIAETCELEANYQWQEQASNLVNVLENQVFMEAASEEEYMNQDVLRQRLQYIFQRKMVDVNCTQQMPSYIGPISEVMPTLGSTHCFNSDAACTPFDHFNSDIIQHHNPMVADSSDQFSFLKGLLDNGNKPGVANMCTDSHVRQISNEMLLSPERSCATFSERNSVITTSSYRDGFPEVGTCDAGLLLSKGDFQYGFEASSKDSCQQQLLAQGVAKDQNLPAMEFSSRLRESSEFPNSNLQILEHVPQIISEDSIFPSINTGMMNSTLDNVLPPKSLSLEQKQQQPYPSFEQFNEPLKDKAPCYFAEEVVNEHSYLPSEQLHGVHVASESYSLFSGLKGTAGPANSGNYLRSSIEQKILLAYVSHKRSASARGDCLVSFVEHLHSTVCNNRMCICERFCSLLSHFDKCHLSDCHICSPVRYQCNKHHRNFGTMDNELLCNSSITFTGCSASCSSENMLPPAKRLKSSMHCSENLLTLSKHLKIEKSCHLMSSENRIASLLAPLLDQPFDPEGLPPLLQWPESPVSINSEVLEGNIEVFKLMQNPSSADQIRNNAGSDFSELSAESLRTPSEELIVGPKPDEIPSRSFSLIADAVKDKSNELQSSSAISEQLGTNFKEEVIQVTSNCDLAKPDTETEKETKPKNAKLRGVSLIEFFSAEEIKHHISSLRQWIGQRISKERKEKPVMHCVNENTCQLCEADKLLLAPVPIYCSSCGSRIKRSVIYYSTSEENGMRHCFCTSCHRDSRGGNITFYGIAIPKAKLDKKKNDEEIEEPWVQCDKCKCWQHQICALFNDKRDMEGKSEYICPKCCLEEIEHGKHMPLPKAAVLGAKDLPSSLLSDYIEERLFRRLQQEREERAKVAGKNFDEVPGAEDLVVREVLSVDKLLKVKQQFLEIFHDGSYPDEFPYRSKVILLFQKIEGVDVCLFGLYVQEFGSECSQPNHRCVYISYLDSVKYFWPETETVAGEALRTFVYHEILIGYLEYCKKRGFVACYLWACPPLKGEDYILYCHPEIQKTPKSDKLRQWYHSMLRKASKENIVVDFTNLYDHFFVPTGKFYSKITAARLPYFDGDYWSGAAENIIKIIEQQNGEHSGRKVKKVMTKRTLKAMGHTNPSGGVTKDILLMQKLGQTLSPVKEDFIVVHLQFVCTYCLEVIFNGWRWCCSQCKNFQLCERCHNVEQGLNGGDTHAVSGKEKHTLSKVMVDDVPSNTKDEDFLLDNWLFENRHIFLGLCQKNHYQFDSLRRAKHSSMMILHHLHNPKMPTAGTTCNICQQDTNTNDSNVCARCCNKNFGSLPIHRSTYHSSAANCDNEGKYAQKKMLEKEMVSVLQHAYQCTATSSDPCCYPNCRQMKRLFLHGSKCTIRLIGGCKICEKMWHVLKSHATICEQTDCSIPRCRDLKDLRFLRLSEHPKYIK